MVCELDGMVVLATGGLKMSDHTGNAAFCLENGVLPLLQSQKKMYTDYAIFAERLQGEYEQAEKNFRKECKRMGWPLPEETEARQPKTMLGKVFYPLTQIFSEAQECPIPAPDAEEYEANKSLFVDAGKMLNQEILIMKWLTHAFVGRHQEAIDMIYKDIPAQFTGKDAKKMLVEVQQARFFDLDQAWSADYHLLCEKSATLKMLDAAYIDNQIDLVQQMAALPDPLAQRAAWLAPVATTRAPEKRM